MMNASWIDYFPPFLRTKLDGRPDLQAALGNGGWLFADKVLRMGLGLVIGVWLARYLGPEQFGLWNYATAFTVLFAAFATLGLDAIVIKELVKNPERQNELLGSAFVLKLVGGVVVLMMAILAISMVRTGDILTLWLVGLSAAGFVFQSVNVIDFYFQAKVQSKYIVLATNGAFVLMAMVKVALLMNTAPLMAFAWIGFFEVALTSLFILYAYHLNHGNLREWRYDGLVARELLGQSWPLVLSSIAIMVYMRIDQIMLGQLLGNKEVGYYSAALKLSEVWYFIPTIALSSVYPTLIKLYHQDEKRYLDKLEKIMCLFFWGELVFALLVASLSSEIIFLLYGSHYDRSSSVLAVHIFSGIVVGMSVIFSHRFILKGDQRLSLYGTIFGAVCNVALNFWWIPRHGMVAAAWATLISYSAPVVLQSLLFDRSIGEIFFRSILRPIYRMKLLGRVK